MKARTQPLLVRVGSAGRWTARIKPSVPLLDIRRVHDNVVEGSVEQWERAALIVLYDGSCRTLVLEPSIDFCEIDIGPFLARGLFRVAEDVRESRRAWERYRMFDGGAR